MTVQILVVTNAATQRREAIPLSGIVTIVERHGGDTRIYLVGGHACDVAEPFDAVLERARGNAESPF